MHAAGRTIPQTKTWWSHRNGTQQRLWTLQCEILTACVFGCRSWQVLRFDSLLGCSVFDNLCQQNKRWETKRATLPKTKTREKKDFSGSKMLLSLNSSGDKQRSQLIIATVSREIPPESRLRRQSRGGILNTSGTLESHCDLKTTGHCCWCLYDIDCRTSLSCVLVMNKCFDMVVVTHHLSSTNSELILSTPEPLYCSSEMTISDKTFSNSFTYPFSRRTQC